MNAQNSYKAYPIPDPDDKERDAVSRCICMDCNGKVIPFDYEHTGEDDLHFQRRTARFDPCFGHFPLQASIIIIGFIETIIGLILLGFGVVIIVKYGDPFRLPNTMRQEMYLNSGIMGLILVGISLYHILLSVELVRAAKNENGDQCLSWIIQVTAEVVVLLVLTAWLGLLDVFGVGRGDLKVLLSRFLTISPVTITVFGTIGFQFYFMIFAAFYIKELAENKEYSSRLTQKQKGSTSTGRLGRAHKRDKKEASVTGRVPALYYPVVPKPMTAANPGRTYGYPLDIVYATSSVAERFRRELEY